MAGKSFVLDTSALMTFIEKETGAERVRDVLLKQTIIIPWLSILETVYISQRELGEEEALTRYALLSRANRKDFYDLYFICQDMPLRRLFDRAPQKFPSTRDFEVQVVKRLVYFGSADYDPESSLLKPVTWQTVKEYFIKQAKEIEQSWLK